MPEDKPQPPQQQPWENGWAPDTTRAPGTRRLWLAGVLAISTIAACVTAITVTRKGSDEASPWTRSTSPGPEATLPGLISFATPSTPGARTPGRSGDPSPTATTTTPTPSATSGDASATASAEPTKSAGSGGGSPSTPKPSTAWTSVRSVNYPDRYWHVSGGLVKLDTVTSASARRDATFTRVKGLADASCYSFTTADGTYLRHREFVLRAESNDDSTLFEQDATFCPRPSASASGAVLLESVNYPGRFLRHKNFQLRLDPYQNTDLYRADSTFRLVDGLS
ncbi:AbfB domain-containing protein [Streptomyces sp. NPDC001315]|uniref:AbfB domain-containing protein n=1 Tax=Streptomyces sp. NPDC001315 TaxID=3364562 RepID=UPI0036C206A3